MILIDGRAPHLRPRFSSLCRGRSELSSTSTCWSRPPRLCKPRERKKRLELCCSLGAETPRRFHRSGGEGDHEPGKSEGAEESLLPFSPRKYGCFWASAKGRGKQRLRFFLRLRALSGFTSHKQTYCLLVFAKAFPFLQLEKII